MPNVNIPEPLYGRIARLAQIEHRSMAAMSRLLIDEALESRRQAAGEKLTHHGPLEKLKSTGVTKITAKRKGSR